MSNYGLTNKDDKLGGFEQKNKIEKNKYVPPNKIEPQNRNNKSDILFM